MKRFLQILAILFCLLMIGSFVLFSTRLNSDLGDKEPIFIVTLFLIFLYTALFIIGLWKFQKTQKKEYGIISYSMGFIYLIFLIYIIFKS